jgi:tetratricopeptide (TPR) repeat protein
MAAGIRFLVKYLNKGKRAFELALKLDSNAKTWNIENPEVLALVWHAIGTANALWSMQSIPSPNPSNKAIEANTRPTIQSAAITAYTTALSYAPNKLETYYQLALQYARQRQLEKSISALSQALRLNKSHIPSIHLLTLVLTALEDYEKALQTCHTVKFDHIDNLNLDDAVALMEMQLTYLRIVEIVSGRELALEAQKGVFKLYSRIFGPVHNGTAIKQESNLEQKATTTEQLLRRTRSNIHPEKHGLDPNFASGGRDSLESKLSLQVPARLGRPRSVLRKQRRSRSVDGGSMDSRSSGDFSEKPTNSSILSLKGSL